MSIEVLRTNEDAIIKKTPFFSVKEEDLKFKIQLENYTEEKVGGYLYHKESDSKSAALELPVEDGFVNLGLKNLDGFLSIGNYEFVLELKGDKKVSLPFMLVDEVKSDAEKWRINFGVMAQNKQGKAVEKEIDVKLQLINIDKSSVSLDKDTKIKTSVKLGLDLNNNSGDWGKGRYEFRVVKDNVIVYRRHYIVK